MLKKIALALTLAAFALATPALAQTGATPKPDQPAAAKPMKKAHAKRSCYDLAWESQAQKDCLAKASAKADTTPKAKTVKKAATKKPA
jgi:hypothetical protein